MRAQLSKLTGVLYVTICWGKEAPTATHFNHTKSLEFCLKSDLLKDTVARYNFDN